MDDLAGQGKVYPQVTFSRYDVEDPVVTKEFSNALRIYLLTLPLSWQQIYDLKFVKGYETARICDALHLTPGNYWVITHRLKGSLKIWYMKNWR
jgi:hypothetical protein